VTVNGFVRTIASLPPANNAVYHHGTKLATTTLSPGVHAERKVLPPSKKTGIATSAAVPYYGWSKTTCCLLFCAKVDASAAGF